MSNAPLLALPSVLLELTFQRRICDRSSIVGDRRGRDYGNDLHDLFFCETGAEECIELLFAEAPPLLDERLRQCGKCGESLVFGRSPLTNRIGLFRTHPLLESERCVE